MRHNVSKQSSPNNVRVIFYLLWLSCSVLQAVFSDLIPDETLYWNYSQRLAWGYFEHAPGIAVVIKAGYALFHNQLGVRLFPICLMALAIFFIEQIIQPRRLALFYMSVASIGVLHILTILAVPDAPLFFFTASFFLLYKRYLLTDKRYLSVLLAINVAALLLCKYHGILIIFFSVIANPHLVRRRSFWLIASLSFLLFLPHIIWQFRNGFPTIVFNLFERDAHYQHSLISVLEYLGAIPLIFIPFTGIVFLYYSFRYKVTTSFERSLKFTFIGTLIFFFIMSLRGHIEANWILCTTVPVIYMGYHSVIEKTWGARLIRISFIGTIILILIARTILVNGLWGIDMDTTNWKQWAKEVQEQAAGRPVVFMNSYQKLGEYEFYTGDNAISMNNIMGRKDQYNLWNDEDTFQGKDIMLVTNYYEERLSSFETVKGTEHYTFINNFRSSTNIEVTPALKEITAHPGDSTVVDFTIKTRKNSNVDAEANPDYPMYISYQFFKDKKFHSSVVTDLNLLNTTLHNGTPLHLLVKTPDIKGDYILLISVSTGWLPPSITGGKVLLHVK